MIQLVVVIVVVVVVVVVVVYNGHKLYNNTYITILENFQYFSLI